MRVKQEEEYAPDRLRRADRQGHPPALPRPGSEIVIQVTKGPIGTKGPRTHTTNLSIPRPLPHPSRRSATAAVFPARLRTPLERKRLKTLINELTLPEGVGVIVRTAGEGKKARYFVRDLHLLLKTWEDIQAKMKSDRAPACLYMEPDLVERTVRDFLTEEVDRVLVDRKEDYERTQKTGRPDLQAQRQ